MIRLLGASLVAGACTWLGFYQAFRLKQRVKTLEDLESGFALLYQRLELGLPLPRLLGELAEKCAGPARELFAACARELARTDREEFSCLWRRAVEECRGLGDGEKNCLFPLGETLGQCALADQKQTVAIVREQLSRLCLRAEEESLRQGRVYRVLGLSGGSFLVILLL